MAKLIVMGDRGPLREHRLSEVNSLGRHPSQSIQILDRLCSKEHARIESRAGVWFLTDLGSRNGTFHNDRLLTGEVRLNHGDILVLGNTRMTFTDLGADAVQSTSSSLASMARVTLAPDLLPSSIEHLLAHSKDEQMRPENNIRDDDQLRRDYEKLRIAYKLQRDIALEVDLDVLLAKILDSFFDSLGCDRGAILLVNAETNQLESRCVKTRGDDESPQDITISKTIIDQVLKDRTAVLSSDASVDSRFTEAHSIILQGIRSTMSVPLIARETDRVLGIIHLDSMLATNVFTERDLSLVQSLGNQAALAIENSLLVAQREADAALREKFSKTLSPILVEQLVAGKLELTKGGQKRQSTVLFSDLRGFTSMSERMDPREIVAMLNEYFEIMVDIVFEFDGTLDKYMGDGIMAVWGSPVAVEDSELKAVKAAVRMREALEEFNQLRAAEGQEKMRMGIGIDTGELVAGYMGSTKTMNYTVIGPPVNLAARLCGVAKPDEVLITDATLAGLRGSAQFQTLDPVKLKGIREPVSPHNVLTVE